MRRNTAIQFGLLASGGYKPSVVRLLTLTPNPGIFDRKTVLDGWGLPDAVGKSQDGTATTYLYTEGLYVALDPSGEMAVTLIFSIPQPGYEKKVPSTPSSPMPSPVASPPSSPAPSPPTSVAPKK